VQIIYRTPYPISAKRSGSCPIG